jgi:hypothetical protein
MATLVTPTEKVEKAEKKKSGAAGRKTGSQAAAAGGREVQDFQRHGERTAGR